MWHQIIFSAICLLSYVIFRNMEVKQNKVKYFSKVFVMYFYVLMVCIIMSPLVIFKKRDLRNGRLIIRSLRPVVKMFGMKWELQNEEYLNKDGGAVIISNHQTTLDAVGLFYAFDKILTIAVIVKRELWCLGIMALAAYKCGTVFIDRRNPKNAYKTLEEITRVLKRDKAKIWIFPEGTRNAGKVKLLPFKRGAFTLAVTAQVPIIPVVMSPQYFINESKCIWYNEGKVIMRCLEPVPTEGLTTDDIPELQERLHKIVSDAFVKLSKEIMNELPRDTSLATEILL